MSNLTPEVTDTRTGRLWTVTGENGAVSFELISAREDVFGPIVIHQPHRPLYDQLPRDPESCDLLDAGICHPDMAFRAGESLGKTWLTSGRNDKVIWSQLESWYRMRLDRDA